MVLLIGVICLIVGFVCVCVGFSRDDGKTDIGKVAIGVLLLAAAAAIGYAGGYMFN